MPCAPGPRCGHPRQQAERNTRRFPRRHPVDHSALTARGSIRSAPVQPWVTAAKPDEVMVTAVYGPGRWAQALPAGPDPGQISSSPPARSSLIPGRPARRRSRCRACRPRGAGRPGRGPGDASSSAAGQRVPRRVATKVSGATSPGTRVPAQGVTQLEHGCDRSPAPDGLPQLYWVAESSKKWPRLRVVTWITRRPGTPKGWPARDRGTNWAQKAVGTAYAPSSRQAVRARVQPVIIHPWLHNRYDGSSWVEPPPGLSVPRT